MFTDKVTLKRVFKIVSILCVVAIAACVIVDLSVNKGFTWSLYTVSAVPFAWLIAAPFLMLKQHKLLCAMGLFTVALAPYLMLLAHLTPVTGWFNPLGLPIAAVSVAAMWAAWLLFRFAKLNKWFFAAAMVLIFGIVVNGAVNIWVNAFLGQSLINVNNIVNLISCAAIVVLLCIIGGGGREKEKEKEKE